MKLWERIRCEMLKRLSQTINEGKAQMTYEEVVIFAEQFSRRLHAVKSCAILCKSEMMASLALLSCFAGGVTAVPLSVRYGLQHCDKILDMVKPSALITDTNGELEVVYLKNAAYSEPAIHPAVIMCTSGTTGQPKGAMLTEHNLLTNINDICRYFRIDESDSILIARPLYHCAVLTGEFLTSLMRGLRIRFYSGQFNPQALIQIIKKDNITVFCGTPTLLGMMARFMRSKEDISLRAMCVSGECLGKELGMRIAEAFPNADIYHVYGLTEASPRVSCLMPSLFKDHCDTVGMPLNSVRLKVIKQDGSVADRNEEGILWVKGENIMVGYYNSPSQTEKVIRDGWLCTGDIATIGTNGMLHIKGRCDDLIIRAGINIYPQEIENALRADVRVRDVYVYKINDPKTGVQIGLNISGTFANKAEVRELCARLLPSFQIPAVINLMDELLRNGSGKIMRGGLHAGT